MTKDVEVLPAIQVNGTTFTPITVDDNDRTTTIQDLEILNTFLEATCQTLPVVRTVKGLESLTRNIQRLIESRRKVKKLPYGTAKGAPPKGRVIEPID